MVIESMASQGKEPTFCMGDDIPLAVMSQKPHMLYDYFKQRFAQVCFKLGIHRITPYVLNMAQISTNLVILNSKFDNG